MVLLLHHSDLVRVAIGDIYKGSALEDFLKKIYEAAGIDPEFTYLPNERAIQSLEVSVQEFNQVRSFNQD